MRIGDGIPRVSMQTGSSIRGGDNVSDYVKEAIFGYAELGNDEDEIGVKAIDQYEELKATATRRLELLKRVHADATSNGHCPFCRMKCTSYSFGSWGEREYEHAEDCKLAKELADA